METPRVETQAEIDARYVGLHLALAEQYLREMGIATHEELDALFVAEDGERDQRRMYLRSALSKIVTADESAT